MMVAVGVTGIPALSSDQHVASFLVNPNERSSASVSMELDNKKTVTCTFDYSTFPAEAAKKQSKADKRRPEEILAAQTGVCLKFDKSHGYEVCIGKEVRQAVGGWNQATPSVFSLGKFSHWEEVQQKYSGGEGTGCPNEKARSSVVSFTCAVEARIVEVSEPETCVYHIVVGVPDVCGLPQFKATPPAVNLETWFLEIARLRENADLVSCTVHATGFGQSSPVDSRLITDFTVRMSQGKTELPLVDFEVRYGDREVLHPRSLVIEGNALQPIVPLDALPNFLVITAELR